MLLDPRALIVATILVTTVLSLLDLAIWRTRKTFPGFGRWAVAHALTAPTLVLFAFRGILPDFLTVIVANALSMLTTILVLEAAREFRGLRPRTPLPYATVGCAVATLIYFRYVVNNLNARAFVASICVGTIGLLAAKALLTDVPKGREIGMRYTGWLVVGCAVLQIGRGVYYCFQPPMKDLFLWSTPNMVTFGGLALGLTGISFGVLVMSGERLMSDLRSSERRTATANLELNRLRRGLETAVVERTKELREAQTALLQAQKLESLGRLAGGVAHDFNNFLTVFRGYCRMLSQDLDPTSPLQDDVAQMNAACEQAIRLTQQLLTFSRRQSLEPRVLDLNRVIGDMAKMLAHMLGDDVEVIIVPAATAARVIADEPQMHQVILNLFLNARDAMPHGGTLEIRTADVEITEADAWRRPGAVPGHYVELSIRDNGIGMDEATLGHVFEPFFTTKPTGQGTGLGLATVYGIVRQNGGHIHVETAPDQGTTFRIFLPFTSEEIVDESAEIIPPSEPVAESSGRIRILIVDDAEPIRKVLRRVLESAGYNVLEAADVDAALDELRRGPVDLILTDLQLPGRSGIELAQIVVREYPSSRVIAMSGFDDVHIGQLPRELGIAAALTKPMQPEILLRTVHAALERKSISNAV
jgi:signal transduction histidine kinase/ActR/RegA family two-component response regulator